MIPRRKVRLYPEEWEEILRRSSAGTEEDGSGVAEWERAVAEYVGLPYAAAVNSGRRGMALILKHLGLGEGDEVIVPAYTLKDLIPLIQRFGAKAIPADIEAETMSVAPEAIEGRITPNTKAILALHAFGAPCRIEAIAALGERHGIAVIEDCAHSLGATVKGRQTGTFGYAGFYSFETTKPINTFGGGMVVSRDASLIEAIHGETAGDGLDYAPLLKRMKGTRFEQRLFGVGLTFPFLLLLTSGTFKDTLTRVYRKMQPAPPSNIRYTPLQAELGLRRFASMAERQGERKAAVERLEELLSPEIRLQQVLEGCESTWCFAIAVLPGPAAPVRRSLLLRGIDAAVEDEIVDDCATSLGYDDCDVAKDVYRRAIMLPMYEGIEEGTLERVAGALNAGARGR
jgi:perosamine synthetase